MNRSISTSPPGIRDPFLLYITVAVTSWLLLLTGCSPTTGVASTVESVPSLNTTDCWFDDADDLLPPHTCYYMTVDETPKVHNGRTVSFPVVAFPHQDTDSHRNPVLHLGGGGPGASLALDSAYNVYSIVDQMRLLSLAQGRDLILIDPRGAGQSMPIMMCQKFVDNVLSRWRQNLTIRNSYKLGYEDFSSCLDDLTDSGMDFSAYSSPTVVRDLEQLREAMGYTQWILYGASYASVYAQLYARDHPERLESMILDSATFLDTPRHKVLVKEFTEPYARLFNFCKAKVTCDADAAQTERRFWKLVDQLDQNPLRMAVTSPKDGTELTIVLSGWRFLDSMLWGVYEESLFTEFQAILDELERGRTGLTRRYVEDLLVYLMDESFGDVSASSHYCVDRKPYIDNNKVREEIGNIPYPYVRDIALLGLEFTDYCDAMSIPALPAGLNEPVVTEVPTLFIHGELDSVTLLDFVEERQTNFPNSHIATSLQSHIVLDDPCIQRAAIHFIENGPQASSRSRCQ